MDDEELVYLLSKWNFWNGEIETGIERPQYLDMILRLLNENNIIAETGIRRSGKSFIAKQVIKKLIVKHGSQNTLIINLEDERLSIKNYDLLLQIYDAYKKIIKPNKKSIIVIDEAQEVDGWERFVRGITERNEASFIVTGSSSKLLSSEFSTLLSGRQITVYITPLDFSEFLSFNNIQLDDRSIVLNEEKLIRYFDEFLLYGGFPAVVINKEKEELLLNYFDAITVKDIVSRYKIREVSKLRALMKFYFTNIASEITYNSTAKFLKIPIKTAQRFSEYIVNANVIFFVERFSFSLKERENSPRKIYSIDNGIALALGTNFVEIKGRALENIVAQQLFRICQRDKKSSIYYWREDSALTGKSVDFIFKSGNHLLPIQVAYEIKNEKTKNRELQSLIKCTKSINVKQGIIITYNFSGEENIEGIHIKYIKAYKWLLHAEREVRL
ncbi:MAG: ATP-binding protein [Candidatus Thermoplasmatota archaeon]|jgi:predicted AAA+ superfamily ATPase|nr:ATP-binding protein [Candidatus Thermoplasmatota archaeon]MCL5963634.1 ATP-binding protein [Candidatus Thermoplasmatota archaeon]